MGIDEPTDGRSCRLAELGGRKLGLVAGLAAGKIEKPGEEERRLAELVWGEGELMTEMSGLILARWWARRARAALVTGGRERWRRRWR